MTLSKKQLEAEWKIYKDKPWHCSECDTFLSVKDSPECEGIDLELPVSDQNKHVPVKAGEPVTFKEFSDIMNRWYKDIKLDEPRYVEYEVFKLEPLTSVTDEAVLDNEIQKILASDPELGKLVLVSEGDE